MPPGVALRRGPEIYETAALPLSYVGPAREYRLRPRVEPSMGVYRRAAGSALVFLLRRNACVRDAEPESSTAAIAVRGAEHSAVGSDRTRDGGQPEA